ncbi:Cytochrome c oxidase assembly factor 1 [Smittium culicis]|uniref:Cytochrome c oxidase assembly factor 1 n=1 Tax=Smittium culicis TaxID=133412 RepID=A0A1R1XK01_9FUNG|nr:Cytochrome c oxidase assembly factor 1 [Smittium culicis]OMJ22416.1 Cytochrome c oxidase assembly factor 1 [Smittium culicis]
MSGIFIKGLVGSKLNVLSATRSKIVLASSFSLKAIAFPRSYSSSYKFGSDEFLKKPLDKIIEKPSNLTIEDAKYDNPIFAIKRDISAPTSNKKKFAMFIVASIITWGIGLKYAFNYSKMSSSSVTAAIFIARHDPEVIEKLGSNIDTASMFTEIKGTVSNVKGNIDVEFDISGSKKVVAKIVLKCHREDKNKNTWTTEEFYVLYPDGSKTLLEM